MTRSQAWRNAWFRFVGETSGPEWERYLFRWERPHHVWLAVALFFVTLLGGTVLMLLVGNVLGLHDLAWLRMLFMATFLTAWFAFVRPVRQAVSTGAAVLAAQAADLVFRRTVTDAWPAVVVSFLAAAIAVVVVVRLFNHVDSRRRAHSH